MPLDTRPFLKLTTPKGVVLKCGHPKVFAQAIGVSDGAAGTVADNATHTITVYRLGRGSEDELVGNTVVYVNVVRGAAPVAFRIMRNGVGTKPGTIKLYVRAEDAVLSSAPDADTNGPAPVTGWIDP